MTTKITELEAEVAALKEQLAVLAGAPSAAPAVDQTVRSSFSERKAARVAREAVDGVPARREFLRLNPPPTVHV